jgi:hypothetical protein
VRIRRHVPFTPVRTRNRMPSISRRRGRTGGRPALTLLGNNGSSTAHCRSVRSPRPKYRDPYSPRLTFGTCPSRECLSDSARPVTPRGRGGDRSGDILGSHHVPLPGGYATQTKMPASSHRPLRACRRCHCPGLPRPDRGSLTASRPSASRTDRSTTVAAPPGTDGRTRSGHPWTRTVLPGADEARVTTARSCRKPKKAPLRSVANDCPL